MDNLANKELIERLIRELEREKLSRIETETIAENITLELSNINKKLQTIFDISKDGIAIIDLDSNFLLFNNSYLKMTGFTYEELLQKSCINLSAPEDIQKAKDAIQEVIKIGFLENFEKICIVKDGRRLAMNISLALIPDKKRILMSVKDITEQKRKEKIIRDYVQLVDKCVITSSTDLKGNITYVSDAFCEISGYSKNELIGKNHRLVKHPDMDSNLYTELWNAISSGMVWVGEMKNLKKNGEYYWVQASISPRYDEYGKKIGYTSVRQDITDRKKLEQISITDALTNIYNRRYFNDIFAKKVLKSHTRDNNYESFLIIDIDHFKEYNDHYGHQMGDYALIKVARTLLKSLKREDDYCFRLGGEEFGVLYGTLSKEKGIEYADLIRNNIENLKIEHVGNSASHYLTVSIGLIVLGENNKFDTTSEIYNHADRLLYEAKKSGRNQIKFD